MSEAPALFFSSIALVAAVFFFWRNEKIAGLAFLAVFVITLASSRELRVVLSGGGFAVRVERDRTPSDIQLN